LAQCRAHIGGYWANVGYWINIGPVLV